MRDERAITWKKTKTVMAGVGSFVALIALGLFVDALKNTSFALWIFGPFLEDPSLKTC